ncbi:universal stress protein UspA [Halobiforma lacisalsi AJ5]|uniref:Universal stress protein UspA n=1 Tax=Natronobacterium lacisalsi AJ5 TaxID=358396 RepID=M0LLF9_NATLA|nr:universal stress protein [Halobiforma lacisalsi]APW98502.1 universal stress protein UspA [Halobiforma lacisalsi AJ5]EMA33284.1 UspA domain-containing protein [Halobiforma lacisalsi AJ5]
MDVLIPIDDSDPARKAVAHAVESHPVDDTDLYLLHVVDLTTAMYGEESLYAYDALIEARCEAAERLFDEAVEIAAEAGHDPDDVTRETVVGRPAREIVEYAEDHGVDAVVIGSHGRKGASRILLGSVAEQVVRRAPVPVTVVR